MPSKKKSESPLLIKYLQAFEKNPDSLVFAPLAETYRSLGMHQEALDILRQGLKKHPRYISGILALACTYFDLGRFDQAYQTLRPVAHQHLENIKLQKIFAQTCLKLEKKDEALETYKYLLFLNPKDATLQSVVQNLEDRPRPSLLPSTPEQSDSSETNEQTPWVEVNFSNEPESPPELPEVWEVKSLLDEKQMVETEDEIPEFLPPAQKRPKAKDKKPPFLSLTLVDLYLKQNLLRKAQEILLKFQEMAPDDPRIKEKLEFIQGQSTTINNAGSETSDSGQSEEEEVFFNFSDEDDEHDESVESKGDSAQENSLMDYYDAQMSQKTSKTPQIEEKYTLFLEKIRKEAESKLSSVS